MKIRCKATGCGSVFNSDYQLQNNREKHAGRAVPYEAVDAVAKLFEAAARKKQLKLQSGSTDTTITESSVSVARRNFPNGKLEQPSCLKMAIEEREVQERHSDFSSSRRDSYEKDD